MWDRGRGLKQRMQNLMHPLPPPPSPTAPMQSMHPMMAVQPMQTIMPFQPVQSALPAPPITQLQPLPQVPSVAQVQPLPQVPSFPQVQLVQLNQQVLPIHAKQKRTMSKLEKQQLKANEDGGMPFCDRCQAHGHAAVQCQEDDDELRCVWCGFRGHIPSDCRLSSDTTLVKKFMIMG